MKKFTDAPIPYFGNKKYIADTVWELFGDVRYYVEPFAGILGCLLYRPAWHEKFCETVNDLNGYLVNMWRSIQLKPDETAHYSADMVSEMDYHAKWYYLRHYDTGEFCERLEKEPAFCDPKLAGWYIEVMCAAIGEAGNRVNVALPGMCGTTQSINKGLPLISNNGQGVNVELPHISDNGCGVNAELPLISKNGQGVNTQLPHISDNGRGVNAELPLISKNGQGVNTQLPHIADAGNLNHKEAGICAWFRQLSERLCDVRVCYGDWKRVLQPTLLAQTKSTAIFFDPPYAARKQNVYQQSDDVAGAVRAWCEECYLDPKRAHIKIILCGNGEEHDSLLRLGWTKHAWKARNGFNGRGSKNKVDKRDEQLWISPCVFH